jgi:AraC family transcriptional regulator of adaptative response / DNA-3-methyladenine glycosylase II
LIARALKLIQDGILDDGNVAALAQRLDLSERHLRRVFDEQLGAGPIAVHTTRRLLFAKQLLTETALPITEIALAAGFQSLRRFNACFRDAYRMPPRDLRRGNATAANDALRLRLGYRPPYDFAALLDFLGKRAIPGVERVTASSYERGFGDPDTPGWLRVTHVPNQDALLLEIRIAQTTALPALVAKIRRMFDLDADPKAIHSSLATHPVLRKAIKRHPGQRVPGGFDGFEVAVRAVLGQQVSVAAARTLAARIVQHFSPADSEPGSWRRRASKDSASPAHARPASAAWRAPCSKAASASLPNRRSKASSSHGRGWMASAIGPRNTSRCAPCRIRTRFRLAT